MTGRKDFNYYAVLYELSRREFRQRLESVPEDMRFLAVLANSIVGAANAQRLPETPPAVVEESAEFVGKLLAIAPEPDEAFRRVLEDSLVDTLRGELRSSCQNCAGFGDCIGMERLAVGSLFERRVLGEETDGLKREIERQVEEALQHTPYAASDDAHKHCPDFRHQYAAASLGTLFGRYADIAAELRTAFGIDYRRVQSMMVALNMDFCAADDG